MKTKTVTKIVVLLVLLVSLFPAQQMSVIAAADTAYVESSLIPSTLIPIPYVSQFDTGAPTKGVDCGPTTVAMVLQALGKRPAGFTDAQFIADIRSKMGKPGSVGTGSYDRQKALTAYGVDSTIITSANTNPLQTMRDAVAQGKPVLARVNASKLGRSYTGHVVVVVGFSSDGQTVYINDPDSDYQNTSTPGGGPYRAWPVGTFETAMKNVTELASEGYGLIVNRSLQPATCPASITGWKTEIFNGTSLSGPLAACRNDAEISFAWELNSPTPVVFADNFSVRFTKVMNFAAGDHTFTLMGDDGIRLFVDGNKLIDKWIDQGITEYSAKINLSEGSHTVVVEYYEHTGGATVKLRWTPAELVVTTREKISLGQTYAGNVSSVQYEKWPVSFGETSTFTITATTTSGDLVPLIVLQNANGTEVARGSGSLTSTQPSGNYYVIVRPQSGSGAYNLKVQSSGTLTDTPTPPPPGGLMSLASLSAASVYVGETADVTVTLNGVPADGLKAADFDCVGTGVEINNITDAGLFGPDAVLAVNGPMGGSFTVGIAPANGNKAIASGAVLRFVVKAETPGTSTITCKVRVSKDGNTLEEVPFTVASLTIQEKTATPTPTEGQTSYGILNGIVTASKPVIVTVKGENDTVANEINANPDGSFSMTLEAGIYTIFASAEGCLSAQSTVTVTADQTISLPPVTLLAGDVNGDGQIDPLDVISIGANYGKSTPTQADLNGDGEIDVLDLYLLAQNYRLNGPIDWK